jgi:hypothetical protein
MKENKLTHLELRMLYNGAQPETKSTIPEINRIHL